MLPDAIVLGPNHILVASLALLGRVALLTVWFLVGNGGMDYGDYYWNYIGTTITLTPKP